MEVWVRGGEGRKYEVVILSVEVTHTHHQY